MYVIRHHNKSIYFHSRTIRRQISEGLADGNVGIVQIHPPVVDISEKADSVLRADGYKIRTAPAVIVAFQPNRSSMMFFGIVFHLLLQPTPWLKSEGRDVVRIL